MFKDIKDFIYITCGVIAMGAISMFFTVSAIVISTAIIWVPALIIFLFMKYL